MMIITIETKDGDLSRRDSLKIPKELLTLSEVFDRFTHLLVNMGYTQEEITCEINEICLDKIREDKLRGIFNKCQRQ